MYALFLHTVLGSDITSHNIIIYKIEKATLLNKYGISRLFYSMCVFLQTQQWKGPCDLSSVDCGWHLSNGRIMHLMTDIASSPEAPPCIIRRDCSTDCTTNRYWYDLQHVEDAEVQVVPTCQEMRKSMRISSVKMITLSYNKLCCVHSHLLDIPADGEDDTSFYFAHLWLGLHYYHVMVQVQYVVTVLS